MITYNMRYRGPYEYDKFVLNIFQFLNQVKDIENELDSSLADNIYTYQDKLNDYIDKLDAIQHNIYIETKKRLN